MWLVVHGLLPVATVYLTRAPGDSLVILFRPRGDPRSLRSALLPAALMPVSCYSAKSCAQLPTGFAPARAEFVQDHISSLIHRQPVAADLASFETPEFDDHLHRARSEARSLP